MMENLKLVAHCLEEKELYPTEPADTGGLKLTLEGETLCMSGTPEDLIDLADLLVSLALSGENCGQHWHVDENTMVDECSKIRELVLSRR